MTGGSRCPCVECYNCPSNSWSVHFTRLLVRSTSSGGRSTSTRTTRRRLTMMTAHRQLLALYPSTRYSLCLCSFASTSSVGQHPIPHQQHQPNCPRRRHDNDGSRDTSAITVLESALVDRRLKFTGLRETGPKAPSTPTTVSK